MIAELLLWALQNQPSTITTTIFRKIESYSHLRPWTRVARIIVVCNDWIYLKPTHHARLKRQRFSRAVVMIKLSFANMRDVALYKYPCSFLRKEDIVGGVKIKHWTRQQIVHLVHRRRSYYCLRTKLSTSLNWQRCRYDWFPFYKKRSRLPLKNLDSWQINRGLCSSICSVNATGHRCSGPTC